MSIVVKRLFNRLKWKGDAYPVAFDTLDGKLVVVAADADRLTLVRDEGAGTDRARTLGALETVLVPLLRLVEILLGTFNTRPHAHTPFSAAPREKRPKSFENKTCLSK